MSAWNPWKVTSIVMALVIATALATGLVVANWKSDRVEPTAQAGSQSAPQTAAPRAAGSRCSTGPSCCR
jgi:ABC-type phosphate transport system substrate-binding protein